MSRTLDDIYREVLWKTSQTTTDFPYVYAGGGAYGFLQTFADVYKYLVAEVTQTDSDFFLQRSQQNIVKDQEDYNFPDDMIRLRHIEFQLNGTNWYRGEIIDPVFFRSGAEQSEVSAASTSNPRFWLMGINDVGIAPEVYVSAAFRLAPRPVRAVTNGIKIYYDRMPMDLLEAPVSVAISKASTVVEFLGRFEYLIPLGVAIEIWGQHGVRDSKIDDITRYRTGVEDLKRLIKPRASVGQKRIRDFREVGVAEGNRKRSSF